MSPRAAPEFGRPVRLVFGAALAVCLALAVWLAWRTAILEPYSDMFDWMQRYYRLQADGDFGRYLWAPHNFHHLVWTFLVLDLDIRAFGASGYLFLAVGVVCLAATAAMLAYVAAKAAGPGLRLVGGGGAAALSAMGCHVLDASADINTTYVHALVFAVAAILLSEGPSGRLARIRQAAALTCALAAGLGSAAGLAVWPALLFGALRRRKPAATLAVLAVGGAFALLYGIGESGPLNPAAGATGPHRAFEAVGLILNYLGLPWGRGIPGAGGALGLVVLLASGAALAFDVRRAASWPERAAAPLILFSLGTAVMVGVARTGVLGPGVAPMRYAVFLIPLHVGLWILALPHLRRAWERWPRSLASAVVAAAAFMLVNQGVMAVYAVRTADANLQVIADFRAGKRTPAMVPTIYPDPGAAQPLSDRMRREGLYQRELRPDPRPLSGSGIWASWTDRASGCRPAGGMGSPAGCTPWPRQAPSDSSGARRRQ